MEAKRYLTASHYYRYLNCPHWPYYDWHATESEKSKKRELTQGERERQEDGLQHERSIIAGLLKDREIADIIITGDPVVDCDQTLDMMRSGVEYIYQGTLTADYFSGRPDLLKKESGHSDFGDWYYIPIDIKSSHSIQKYHRLQLQFYAIILEKLQGRFPSIGKIINKDGHELEISLGEDVSDFEEITQDLERIMAGEKPEPLLRKSCFDVSPWGKACQEEAESHNDIALLYNVDRRRLKALRSLGINRVDQAAEMDVIELDGKLPGLRRHGLEVARMQALSLRGHTVFVREAVDLPKPEMEIHFDIESDPPTDTDYLLGCFIRTKTDQYYKAFVAHKLEDESLMWHEFLAWLDTLTLPYQVIHYASYEKVRLSVLRSRYGGSPALDRFVANLIDLKTIATSSLVVPQYFYGLKYLAKFFGYHWRGDIKNGGTSVDYFEKYLETGDKSLMDQILMYNEDDVRATALLSDWCRNYAGRICSYADPYPWLGQTLDDYKS